jgi:putative ABC transport system substrate-binding protein
MRRLSVLLACLLPLAVQAQARIAVLTFTQITPAVRSAMHDALGAEGYVEGRNLRIEWRAAEGQMARARTQARELAELKVDLIVAMATPAVRAAREATATIPIVMAPAGDPLATGFVATLAKPGGNITGVSGFGTELSAKRVEALREVLPSLRRIGLLTNGSDPFAKPFIAENREVAGRLGLELHIVDVRRPQDIGPAYAEMKRHGVEAVVVQGVLSGPAWNAAQLALEYRLPALSFLGPFADSGGLMYYSQDAGDVYRRAASFVRRILAGAEPGDLPVERPTQTELVINLKTAEQLGLAIPPSLLLRADRLIR